MRLANHFVFLFLYFYFLLFFLSLPLFLTVLLFPLATPTSIPTITTTTCIIQFILSVQLWRSFNKLTTSCSKDSKTYHCNLMSFFMSLLFCLEYSFFIQNILKLKTTYYTHFIWFINYYNLITSFYFFG